ncbi:hypothetical protein PN419_00270 [Halorubrum ezzemoulense]|uniref:hypothetical protein n=1 Tax=Halorubrum ezzemoulense TaxID=337243 RepID=UPI00232B8FCB|nr:hypothetical protein [Halorubrum ezzemoulense]MDB9247441.1 hypothetical protein [Halorubrum ezzemoulense]MDB9258650.1 hypothetical protein [Halorubrum ezzemoulense]MDB9264492.1 hypothetical protein [Halorubrum ezzemoulense]MDB9269011.1 hypothetical protein [Halorubrum ezzemoulense]MDB9271460.1 hypothetical protein [Halorubrum ezzemoulense]
MSDNYETLVDNDPNPAIDLNDDERLDALLRAFAATLDKLDSEIEQTYDDLFIDTASFEGLEDRAAEVGVQRKDTDSLEQFRTRVRARFGEATSEATLTDFAKIVLRVLDTDSSAITVRGSDTHEEPIVVVEADNGAVEGAAFDQSTLVDLLRGSVGAGGNVEIQTYGTFELSGPNYDPPSSTGLNEGTLGSTIR